MYLISVKLVNGRILIFRNKVKVKISIFVKFNIKVCSVFTTNKITIIMRFNNNLKVIRN